MTKTNDYLRLSTAPEICWSMPQCSACWVDLEYDDSWYCPSCGTNWRRYPENGEKGVLYADWSGDQPGGPEVTDEEARHIGDLEEPRRSEHLAYLRDRAKNPGKYV